jgi:hypothetical protein
MDAMVCALGGADFLLGRAAPPRDLKVAHVEGWIWAARPEEPNQARSGSR